MKSRCFRSENKDGRIIKNVEQVLNDKWKKESLVEIFPMTYSNVSGDTIVYYVCKTTYYLDTPVSVEGVDEEAIKSIIDSKKSESSRECKVNDADAVIYVKGNREYLCWTMSSEYSCIIEYSPENVAEEEIFKMAESVSFN